MSTCNPLPVLHVHHPIPIIRPLPPLCHCPPFESCTHRSCTNHNRLPHSLCASCAHQGCTNHNRLPHPLCASCARQGCECSNRLQIIDHAQFSPSVLRNYAAHRIQRKLWTTSGSGRSASSPPQSPSTWQVATAASTLICSQSSPHLALAYLIVLQCEARGAGRRFLLVQEACCRMAAPTAATGAAGVSCRRCLTLLRLIRWGSSRR